MLTSTVLPGTDIVHLHLTSEDGLAEEVDPAALVRQVIATYGSARLLVQYDPDASRTVDHRAAWEDLRVADLLQHVDAVAVLAGRGDHQAAQSALEAWTAATVHGFAVDQLDQAVRWLIDHDARPSRAAGGAGSSR